MFDLRYYGDSVLRKTAAPVEKFDDEFALFVDGMVEALRLADGVGLAAPQIGAPIRLVVIDTTYGEAEPYILANPEIIDASIEETEDDEGCLSLPGITLTINRRARVSVRAQNVLGESYVIENADGLLSRALQHEIDHLNGILLIDHVSSVQRTLLKNKLKQISKAQKSD